MQPSISFIGAGNMSRAILGGMLSNGYPAEKVSATGRDINKLADLAAQGINTTTDNHSAMSNADIVVLAVKPQMMRDVISPLASNAQQNKPLIVSVAAGIPADSIDEWLGGGLAVIRCMPNTPALVQKGASGLFANQHVNDLQKNTVQNMIASTGVALWVDTEEQLDAVAALSGSGPAYYFLLMESMINAAQAQGLSRETAEQLTLQTALGAATIAQQSEDSPAELRRKVTSPKGTTEQAIMSFERADFSEIIKQGMQANINRSKELAIELG